MATNRDKIRAAAQKHLQRGQIDKAIKEFQRLVDDDPKDIRTLLKIGDLHTRKGDHAAATSTYRQVAEFYSAQGFFLKAVAVYKQILKLDPSLVEVNLQLAELYQQLGLLSDAANQFRHTYQMYERAGRSEEGLETLQKIIELDPDNVASRVKLAEAYAQQKRLQDACQGFREAAAVLKSQGRLDDYVKVGERLVHFDPDDSAMAKDLAEVYMQRGDPKRALAKLQICYRSEPNDLHTLRLMADAFRSLGQAQKTVSVYREVVRIHDEAGDHEGRLAACRSILELDPNDADAKAALAPTGAAAEPTPSEVSEQAQPTAETGGGSAVARISVAHRQVGVPSRVEEVNHEVAPTPASPAAASTGGEIGSAEVDKLLVEVEIYTKYGLRNKALEHLDGILAAQPSHREAQEKRKALLIEEGDTEAAAQALWAMAEAASASGMLAQAKADVAELLTLKPDHAAARSLAEQLGAEVPAEAVAPASAIEISIDEMADGDGDEMPEVLVEEADDTPLGGEAADGFAAEFDADVDAVPAPSEACEQRTPGTGGDEGDVSLEDEVAVQAAAPAPGPADDEIDLQLESDAPAAGDDLGDADASLEEGISVELDTVAANSAIAATLQDDEPAGQPDHGLELEDEEASPPPAAPRARPAQSTASLDLELEPGDGAPSDRLPPPSPLPTTTAANEPPSETPPSAPPEASPDKAGLDPDLEALIASAVPSRRSSPSQPAADPAEPTAEKPAAPVPRASPAPEAGPGLDTEDGPARGRDAPQMAADLSDDGGPLSAEDAEAALSAAEAAILENEGRATDEDVCGAAEAAAEAVAHGAVDEQRSESTGDTDETAEPAAAPAAQTDVDIAEDLEEVHFLIDQGLVDEAQEAVSALLAQFPAHPQVLELTKLVGLDGDAPAAEIDDDAEPEPEISMQSVDLSEEIAEELGDESWNDDFQVSLAEVFDEFKRGVAEQVDDSDHETHYDLGIAYKEMGLVDDAIREFNLAARAPDREISALTMVGLCELERGNASGALQTFLRGLNSERVTPSESVALRYEIGFAYESQGRQAEARRFFEKAHTMDPQFRDVAQRLQRLGDRNSKIANVTTELDELLNETRAEQEAMRRHRGKVSYL